MRRRTQPSTIGSRTRRAGLGVCLLLVCGALGAAASDDDGPVERTHDGLVLVPDTEVMAAWIRPDADFSGYEKVMILEAQVAFRQGWQRDQNRTSVNRVSARDMERIKDATAELLFDAFAGELTSDGDWEIVTSADADVLLLRPAIIDLDVTAPDTRSAGRTRNFTSSAGAATLYLELFDSVSGQILGRAADRRVANTPGNVMTMSNSVTNRVEAERIFAGWADMLREGLDELRATSSDGD